MKEFDWNSEKNRKLILERNVSFEDVIFLIKNGGLLADLKHPNSAEYPTQRMYIVEIDLYAYLVPYVETEHEIFLKTIIPSRKATKKFLGVNL